MCQSFSFQSLKYEGSLLLTSGQIGNWEMAHLKDRKCIKRMYLENGWCRCTNSCASESKKKKTILKYIYISLHYSGERGRIHMKPGKRYCSSRMAATTITAQKPSTSQMGNERLRRRECS